MTTQATQIGFDGTVLYRWYVWIGRKRCVTWAPDKAAARAKTERRPTVRAMRLRINRIEPAPPPL